MMEESYYYSPTGSPVTDLSQDYEKENAARQALQVLGDLLEGASLGLEELERNEMLGSAIVRKSQELADAVGGLAQSLHNQTNDERRALAQACLQDGSLLLSANNNQQEQAVSSQYSHQLSRISEQDMMEALSGAESLLVDVEGALRSIGQDEADEIADVALTVARLFVASLQSFVSNTTPQQLAGTVLEDSGRVVILNEEDETTTQQQQRSSSSGTMNKRDRVRVLWPPLGPAVACALQSIKQNCAQQPLLAVALGLTLWPAAVVTAVMGTPLVLADNVLQHVYNHFCNGPLLQSAEIGAAQLYHASRLSLLCSGLVWRQTWRVANRQLERHGGVGQVAHDVIGVAMERATHPVETCRMTWDGLVWGAEILRNAAVTLHDAAKREMEREMDKTCQSLQ